MSEQDKKPVGRPPKPMPEPIPDTFENVIKAIVNGPPPKKDKGGGS
jgi:hypothetical protein